MNKKEIEKIIQEAPDKCIITGFEKCKNYLIDNRVVYLSNPPYYAYTLPDYDSGTQQFEAIRYDMDDSFRKEYEVICTLDDLECSDRDDVEKIKDFYGIK